MPANDTAAIRRISTLLWLRKIRLFNSQFKIIITHRNVNILSQEIITAVLEPTYIPFLLYYKILHCNENLLIMEALISLLTFHFAPYSPVSSVFM